MTSRNLCYEMCVRLRNTSATINGVTYGVAGGGRAGECYCERKMKQADNRDVKWITRLLEGNRN